VAGADVLDADAVDSVVEGSDAVQGLGGGALTVTSTALIADVIPLRLRGQYQQA
jgi:MFS family permease